MKNNYRYFLVRLSLFTLILIIISTALWYSLPEGIIPIILPYMFVLFFGVTALTHYILLKTTRLSPMKFVSYYMLSTFVRLLVYLAAVLVYVILNKDHVINFIIAFFILYIFYTVFEVAHFISQTKGPKG
jgi:hypothetical protein